MEKNYCVHPGAFIKAILMSINKTQKWLANEMAVNKIIVSDLIRGKRNVTPNLAKSFEKATGFSAEALLQQQNKYDLFCLNNETEAPLSISTFTEIEESLAFEPFSIINCTEISQTQNNIGCIENSYLQYAA